MKHYPADLIYEPWKATAGEQRQYKCKIGTDYPNRIVIHEQVQDLNKGMMNRAYRAHNEGRSDEFEPKPKVFVKEEGEMPAPFFIKQEIKEEPADQDEDPENIC